MSSFVLEPIGGIVHGLAERLGACKLDPVHPVVAVEDALATKYQGKYYYGTMVAKVGSCPALKTASHAIALTNHIAAHHLFGLRIRS